MNEPRMTHEQALELAPAYVLGALEPAEEAAVRDHLATCPESHAEFEQLGGVVPALLADVELVEPPAALRDRIMAAARADLAGRPESAAVAPTVLPSTAEREIRRRSRRSGFDWALRIAAVIAIVVVGAWGLGIQRQLDVAQRFDRAVAAVLDAADKPGAQAVILSAAKGQQGRGIAAIAPNGTVTLAMRDLPATGGSQVYTTWVIVGTNAPVAVADFTVDSNGIASVVTRPAPTPPGATIALTLEPNAGDTAPKGPIISTGIAPAPPTSTG
jgi:anti-sigma factor RsiW